MQAALQNPSLNIHCANTSRLVHADQWLNILNGAGEFGVEIDFTDPKSGRFYANVFRFYPKAQHYLGTDCYLAEHNGIILRIPADIHWWERHFERGGDSKHPQSMTLVHKGELKTITFDSSIHKVHVIDFVDS